jgi:hypothetical protein
MKKRKENRTNMDRQKPGEREESERKEVDKRQRKRIGRKERKTKRE